VNYNHRRLLKGGTRVILNDEWLRMSYGKLLHSAADLAMLPLQAAGIEVTGIEPSGGQVFLLIRRGEKHGGFSLDRVVDETLFLDGGDPAAGFDPGLQTWEDVLNKMAWVTGVRVAVVDAMLRCETEEEVRTLAGQISASGIAEVRARPLKNRGLREDQEHQDALKVLERSRLQRRRDVV
jgi:hypothetical protein